MTSREGIARSALEAEAGPRGSSSTRERNGFKNVYLDRGEVQEVAWKTAVEAAPLLVERDESVEPDELFDRLKPFKDRVAEDIREDG